MTPRRRTDHWLKYTALLALLLAVVLPAMFLGKPGSSAVPPGRSEVIFWHFWGGADRAVVEEIVRRFNASQDAHFVRAVAVPGQNLDLKFFLSIAGENPPDLLNQDDPIVADWAHRGALLPLTELATDAEYAELQSWLFPAARSIGSYEDRLYALCNGLDVRALYYDATLLAEYGLEPPRTIAELDAVAERIAPPDGGPHRRYGYLPDPRRLWAWGIVFGGEFYDPVTQQVTADQRPVVQALEWMQSYSTRYGADQLAAFRKGDQALSGAAFPLLEDRYALVMDGQWRVRELEAARRAQLSAGQAPREYGVIPLPAPPDGRQNAGWINGNFFVVPRGAKNPAGAWEFMKFWSGFGGNEPAAAEFCIAGGWIPPAQQVVQQPEFQTYLAEHPLFAEFVTLAGSPAQVPTPAVPAAAYFYSEIVLAAEHALYRGEDPAAVLRRATARVQARLNEVSP